MDKINKTITYETLNSIVETTCGDGGNRQTYRYYNGSQAAFDVELLNQRSYRPLDYVREFRLRGRRSFGTSYPIVFSFDMNGVNFDFDSFGNMQKTYAEALKNSIIRNEVPYFDGSPLCMHFEMFGKCPLKEECTMLHGNVCKICNKFRVPIWNDELADRHQLICKKGTRLILPKRLDFKKCGICLEIVQEKDNPCERLFGILANCKHVFCLRCIRKWREVNADSQIYGVIASVTSCPECRAPSDFIMPSTVWIENQTEKDQIVNRLKGIKSFSKSVNNNNRLVYYPPPDISQPPPPNHLL